jgi:hypothetical protein
MKPTSLIAGIGGIAFGVLTFAATAVANGPGGNYKASNATSFVASGHRAAVFVALYLVIIAVLGLIVLLAHLREVMSVGTDEQPVALSIFWGTGLAAAVCWAAGWAVALSVPIAYAVGGDGFSIGPAQTYAIVEAGFAILFGPGSILLGLALIILGLAARATLPAWLRWVTVIAGVLGLASPAFFPWFALLIWGVIIGIWLLAAPRTSASSPLTE